MSKSLCHYQRVMMVKLTNQKHRRPKTRDRVPTSSRLKLTSLTDRDRILSIRENPMLPLERPFLNTLNTVIHSLNTPKHPLQHHPETP